MAIVDELVTILGFDADASGAQAFKSALGGVKSTAIAVGTAIIAAEGAIVAYTSAVASSTDELGKFSGSFGVNSERLQQFEFAAKRAGGSSQELRSDIANITKQLASPVPGEFNQGLFLLGINVRDSANNLKSADEILLELSDRFEGLSAQQRQILATQVGLSEGTIRFISQGREEIERLSALATDLGGVLPVEATKTAAEFADRLTDINLIINGIGRAISINLLPGFTRFLDKTKDIVLENRELIKLNIKAVVDGIGRGFEFVFNIIDRGIVVVKKLLPDLDGISEKFDLARLFAISFVTILGVIAFAFAPVLANAALVGLAIAAIVIIIDDLVSLINGEKSVIGSLFDGLLEVFPSLKPTIENVKNLFSNFRDETLPALQVIFVFIKDLLTPTLEFLGVAGKIAINILIGLFNDWIFIIRSVQDLISIIADLIQGDLSGAADTAKDRFGSLFDFVNVGFQNWFGWIDKALGKYNDLMGIAEGFTIGIAGDVGEKIGETASDIGGKISNIGNEIGDITEGIFDKTSGFFMDQFDFLAKSGNEMGDVVNNIFQSPAPAMVPIGAAGNTINNKAASVQQTNNNTFNISGAQSPQATANAIQGIQGRQQSQLSQAAQTGAYPGIE